MIAGTYGIPIPTEPGPERDQWLRARGWSSFEDYQARGDDRPETGHVTYGRNELRHVMSEIKDLDEARDALIREQSIRHVMAETGEPRKIVVEVLDSVESMAQEAVLDLTEGEPTTLRDALARYLDRLVIEGPDTLPMVMADLCALLEHPYPGDQAGPVLSFAEPDSTRVLLRVTWSGDYYRGSERFNFLKRWIESALDDRDDSPAVAEIVDLGERDVEQVVSSGRTGLARGSDEMLG